MNDKRLENFALAKGEELLPENFPTLRNISAAFLFNFVPRPRRILPPEFVYVPIGGKKRYDEKRFVKASLTLTQWNALWEAGHLRAEFVPWVIRKDFPEDLMWLSEIKDANIYLIPDGRKSKYDAFKPLYHLLPIQILKRFGLPTLKRSTWPPWMYNHIIDDYITDDFDDRVATAFASYIWPLISPGSKNDAFSKDDPIVLLSHNLNYWLPPVCKVAEDRLREFPRVEFESEDQIQELRKLKAGLPVDIYADRPLMGGDIWCGEDDAWLATNEMVDVADRNGKLRSIIDAIKSHRIEDDFSSIWSYAKEDFERKMYHKRAKTRVIFVELDDAKPVHAPTSELHDNLLWEDFLTLLDAKERRIVVCLKSGITRVTEISKKLGYANHSPISKALDRIRKKAKKYLEP